MKNVIKSIALVVLFVAGSAFTTPVKDRKEVKESTITWKGKKILGSHTGTIDLKEGYIEMEGDQLVGGKFIVDMTTIVDTDLEGGSKTKLENHLRSADFFAVDEFPTSTLVIKNATKSGNTYEVNGDLTIKGITKPISFELEMGATSARASVNIDRTLYGIQYGSGNLADKLADNTISNKFELDVILKF
jgi:polyisoprenoid-binding protein YceI